MKIEDTAKVMDSLAHPTRIKIYHALQIAGEDGLNIGQLGFVVDCPASTLSHHLSIMKNGGIVAQRRKGREMLSILIPKAVDKAFRSIQEKQV